MFKVIEKSIFGGMCIGLGAFASCGLIKPLNGIIFSVGLFMIIFLGLKLFTGDILSARNGITKEVIKNWVLIYIGNFIGCYLLGLILLNSGYDLTSISGISEQKANLPFTECFLRGILCNVLVCIAVYLSSKIKDFTLIKAIVIMLPVTLFVISGFEHSVANMFYFTIGQVSYFNLIPATIGNILGGLLIVRISKL